MGLWILVDALLLLAIVVIIVFIVGQTKLNNKNNDNPLKNPTDTVSPSVTTPSPTEKLPTPTATTAPDPSPTQAPTEEPTPTPTDAPTPTPTETPVIKENATCYVKTANIRKGPGTNNDVVQVKDASGKMVDAQLTLNQRVEIIKLESEWYHLYAIVNGQKVEGYVKGTFITPDQNSGIPSVKTETELPVVNTGAYAGYDTIWREWWYGSNTTHTIPKPAYKNDMTAQFPKYGAYYADLTATNDDKVMYLTFDCGYENGYTSMILDTLKKYNIKACFFVTKSYLEQAPQIAKRMKEEGHLVGNHTVTHPQLPKLSVQKIADELNGVKYYFQQVTGYDLDPYMRPPQGDFSETSLKVQQDLGYKTIFWSLAIYKDYVMDYQDKVETYSTFVRQHHSGCIALIHAVSKTNAENLEKVILFLKEQGYRFGTLEELK
jgi:peptidoglycan-N-acetylmuramic acid deacetylase